MDVGRMTLFELMAATRGYSESRGATPRGGTIPDERLGQMGVVGFD